MSPREYVSVGLGDAGVDRPELSWTVNEAQVCGIALRVERAYDPTELLEPWALPPDQAVLKEAEAAQVLVEASRDAVLAGVGTRQLSAIGAVALGSVSSSVIAMADGPVVAVGSRRATPVGDPAVVVGVDGFAGAEDALSFAFEYAARHQRPVKAVACWQHDLLVVTPWPAAHRGPASAQAWLADTLSGRQHKYPEVSTRREVVHDHPVAGLVAASSGHDLLVAGSHGRRAHVVGRIGSVGQAVLHYARCPVAVVRPRGGTA